MSYAFSIADRMLPFRDLLKPDTQFTWNDELQTLFEAFKRLLATCLLQTGPRMALVWLLQKHCSCNEAEPFYCPTSWKITLEGSRFTHAAESRYAPIEGEPLAVADALEKARYFVLG